MSAAFRITYLVLSNHPLATKLPNTTSACALLMFDLGLMELTSRRAARDETQNDSCGASMICSIYYMIKHDDAVQVGVHTKALKYTISAGV